MMSAATKVKVTRIDPTDWFVGLKDASLQLMVYGPGIREAKVTTDYPGVRIDSLVQLDSPNYLLVYLHLNGAKAGQMMLNFEVGKKTVTKYLTRTFQLAVTPVTIVPDVPDVEYEEVDLTNEQCIVGCAF